MGRFNFSGDLEQISERQLDFIGTVLEKRGFQGPEAKVENVGAAGDNYMANIKRITVTENKITFKMIAKIAHDNEILRLMAQVALMYKNEHTIYTELLPKFAQIQKRAGIPDKYIFRFAECYGSFNEAPNEVILLEDLKESHFYILDRFKTLNSDTVKLVLKNFAIFHSLSYVLKHQEPNTFAEISPKLGNVYDGPMSKTEDGKKYFEQLEASTLALMTEEKYRKYIKGSVSEIFNIYSRTTRGDIGSKRSVIRQGDGWTNNIMFRSENDVQEECILIDYQIAGESNPSYDIMYFLFNSTSHEQRQKHYYEFLDHYHRELDLSLHNFGLKASLVLPRDQLDCDLKRFGKLILAMSIMISHSILKKVEEAEKMKEVMKIVTTENKNELMEGMFDLDPETVVLFKSKIEGLIDSFVEFGLI